MLRIAVSANEVRVRPLTVTGTSPVQVQPVVMNSLFGGPLVVVGVIAKLLAVPGVSLGEEGTGEHPGEESKAGTYADLNRAPLAKPEPI